MKLSTVVIAALAVVSCSASLQNDFEDFVNLLPKLEMDNIYIKYLLNDDEVLEAFSYMGTDEYKQSILDLEDIKEYQNLLIFMQNSGVDVFAQLQLLHELMGLPPYVPPQTLRSTPRGKGLKGMIEELEEILPKEEIQKLYNEKMETSEEFAAYAKVLKSEEYKDLYCKVDASPEYQKIVNDYKSHSLDVYLTNSFNMKIFNLEIVTC